MNNIIPFKKVFVVVTENPMSGFNVELANLTDEPYPNSEDLFIQEPVSEKIGKQIQKSLNSLLDYYEDQVMEHDHVK